MPESTCAPRVEKLSRISGELRSRRDELGLLIDETPPRSVPPVNTAPARRRTVRVTFPGPPALPGPPPRRPLEPHYVQMTHVLHLLLTLLTCGLWGVVWFVLALVHGSRNGRLQSEYVQALARWEHDYWAWEESRRRGG
jgi:hypothetical protein